MNIERDTHIQYGGLFLVENCFISHVSIGNLASYFEH